jgi:hypothetical protein
MLLMNFLKKKLLLIIALLFPLLLVLLFQFDSEGVYEVPLLFEDGVKQAPATCSLTYPVPYILPDSITHELVGNKMPTLMIISFDTTSREVKRNLNRVREQFSRDDVLIKENLELDSTIVKCQFLVHSDSTVVMIDKTGRIRGYYNGNKREEVDRLLDEGKIILKKY